MSKELIAKVVRYFVSGLSFLCLLTVLGMDNREAQRLGMILVTTVAFGFLLRNIWVTLFLGWTVFLYVFFKFRFGELYLSSIFYGCLLYYLTKISFEKKHINTFINCFLWVVFLNIGYLALQVMGYDFIGDVNPAFYKQFYFGAWHKPQMTGFMWNAGFLGCLMAFAVPILASRGGKVALLSAFLLFIPLFLVKASIMCLGAIIGLLFVLWYKVSRKVMIFVILLLTLLGAGYLKYDFPKSDRVKHWKYVLTECVVHPVTGWGLDSFSKLSPNKNFMFSAKISKEGDRTLISAWDNPHNLIISLLFEFGVIGIFLVGGYFRQCAMKFQQAIKDNNTIGLAGFLVVFLVVSMASFPIFLARMAVLIIPVCALFEISVRKVEIDG